MYKMEGWIMKEHGVPNSKITVIKRNLNYKKEKNIKSHDTFWDCKCSCGNTFTTRGYDIRHGIVKSCGCLLSENKPMLGIKPANAKNLIGQRYGKLTVLKDSGKRHEKKGEILWLCECDCGNTCLVRTSSLTKERGTISCGCIASKGEEKIAQILKNNNIKFSREYTYKDLLSPKGRPLRYDFLINNYFLLEFDGKQHFEEDGRSTQTLQERQLYDKIKNEYAKLHNIPLKRIPYWDLNKITIENIMDDTYLIK